MPEQIVVNSTVESINVNTTQDNISVSNSDIHFSIVDVSETINVSLVDNTTQVNINDVHETISTPIVNDVIAPVYPSEEKLTFTSSEPTIIVNKTTTDNTQYSERVDFVNDTLIYKGIGAVGSTDSSLNWQIQKIEFIGVDQDISISYANGNSNFTNSWTDRATYSYS